MLQANIRTKYSIIIGIIIRHLNIIINLKKNYVINKNIITK